MGCFFGKVKINKGKNEKKVKRIVKSDKPDYKNYNSEEFIQTEFSIHYKLEKNEIFYIKYDERVKGLIKNKDVLEINNKNTSLFDEITSEDWKNLDFIVYVDEDMLYFQRIVGKKYLTTKKFLGMCTGTPSLKEEQEGIEINEYSDFSFSRSEERIYFRDFLKVSKILNGMDELYREASVEETKNFLNSEFIKSEKIDIKTISVSKRKKIAQAIDKLKDMDIESLIEYGKKYSAEVFLDDKVFVKDAKDIDIALKIIFEKFDTTEVTHQKREINSSKTLS